MTPRLITFSQVQTALMRCMTKHPPEGDERRLHPEASRLADLFGEMWYAKTPDVMVDSVPPDIRDLFEKWKLPETEGKSALESIDNP
jgi:hypothetical protein